MASLKGRARNSVHRNLAFARRARGQVAAEVRHDDGNWGASLDRAAAPAGLRVTVRLAEVGALRRVFLLRE